MSYFIFAILSAYGAIFLAIAAVGWHAWQGGSGDPADRNTAVACTVLWLVATVAIAMALS